MRRPNELSAADFPIPLSLPADNFEDVASLLRLCAAGRLYEVEEWIGAGRSLQWRPTRDRKLRRRASALQIAVDRGFYSLAALLLANGYDPNGDASECLSVAVHRSDGEMVELLLRFGADPARMDFATVLETCNRQAMDRFVGAGVDPCAANATARALASKRRPILGFVKQYRTRFPNLQGQVDIALHSFTKDGDRKGVSLMLWLGADPHAVTPSSAYVEDAPYVENESSFRCAIWGRDEKILSWFLPSSIPADQVQPLFRLAAFRCRPELVRRLLAAGANPHETIEGEPLLFTFICAVTTPQFSPEPERSKHGLASLEILLRAGAKWEMDDAAVRKLRGCLLRGNTRTVRAVLDLLQRFAVMTDDAMRRLTRTAAMARIIGDRPAPGATYLDDSSRVRSGRRGYRRPHWAQRWRVELPGDGSR